MKNTRALFKGYKKKKMTIRSKHNNLLNYFVHDKRDLSRAYVKSCEKFLKEISDKQQATSGKPQAKKDLTKPKI